MIGVDGVSLCWESVTGTLVALTLRRTCFFAAHAEAVHGIVASLLLFPSLTDIKYLISGHGAKKITVVGGRCRSVLEGERESK